MDIVTRWATLLEEEGLSEAHGVASLDAEAGVDHHKDAIVHARLEVEHCSLGINSEAGETAKLAHDLLGSHKLLSLVGHQGLVSVESCKVGAVAHHCSVIVLNELLSNILEIGHLCLSLL